MNHYEKQLDWLLTMYNHPGFKDHAEWMAEKMDKGQSGLFNGIAAELKERLQKLQNEQKQIGG